MNRIIINSVVAAATDFNNYVVVKVSDAVTGMNMALVSKDATTNNFDIVKSYPIFGYAFEKTVTANYLYFTDTTVTATTKADAADNNLALIDMLAINTAAKTGTCAMAGVLSATPAVLMYAGATSANF